MTSTEPQYRSNIERLGHVSTMVRMQLEVHWIDKIEYAASH